MEKILLNILIVICFAQILVEKMKLEKIGRIIRWLTVIYSICALFIINLLQPCI